MISLTPQQAEALRRIEAFLADAKSHVFILKGYAGTGKTTLLRYVADHLAVRKQPAQFMAPTGRAAKVLRAKLPGCRATTLHRGIYEFSHLETEEEEGVLHYVFPLKASPGACLCIVDEASMVSAQVARNELFRFGTGVLLDDLLTYARPLHGGKLLFAGDPMQLPPVGDNRSAALSEEWFAEKGLSVRSFELTDIVRQDKGHSILANATQLRHLLEKTERNRLVFKKREGETMGLNAADVAARYCDEAPGRAAIVCFSNQQAADYNTAVRRILFPDCPCVTAGDRLMISSNNYYGGHELLNGDIVTVTEVGDKVSQLSAPVWTEEGGEKKQRTVSLTFREVAFRTEDGTDCRRLVTDHLLHNNRPSLSIDEQKALYINTVIRLREKGYTNLRSKEFAQALAEDPYYNAVHAKFGYASTCHKAQGGEWETVFVDFTRRTGLDTDSLRWKYTAITRAKHRLWCVNLPDITPLSALTVTPIAKAGKIPPGALSFDPQPETPFHPAEALPGEKAKYWSVARNMEGTPYAIKAVARKPYRNIYEVETPGGAARVDALYNGAGLFTQYQTACPDAELTAFFENEENLRYRIAYEPKAESLAGLHARMVSLCDEGGIVLTSVVEKPYQLVYFLRASGRFASLTFSFNAAGFVSHANPLSDMGAEDEKLARLIEKLKQGGA